MQLFNTLTGAVEPLRSRDEGRIGIYVCGPTVQGPPHFGHARTYTTTDVLRRFLEWTGTEVYVVRNITDIEDKIISRAAEEGRTAASLAEHYTRIWEHEIARLGIRPPDVAPRATGHVPEILELIAQLIERGAAYPAGGDVYFAVRAFDDYGKLSGRRPDELRSGARIAPDERKRDPLDFVLWKGAKPGEPTWSSPWGPGRPGWHIECSAMSTRYLGADFDLHVGGSDLRFPHHENEIAQWEAATGTPFAHHWMHTGMLTLDDTKMSKSLGNIISLAEATDRYGPATLRMFYLRAHYRRPVEFSEARLEEAAAAYERMAGFVRATAALGVDGTLDAVAAGEFREALEDDLSPPGARAAVSPWGAAANPPRGAAAPARAGSVRATVVELAGVLGFDFAESAGGDEQLVDGLIGELVALREEARGQLDFAAADRIRDRLHKLGVELADGRAGTRWHITRR